MDGLTPKQEKCLDFIRSFLDRNGYPPTLRDVQKHFGFSSQTSAENHVKALERKGFISHAAGQARTIRLIEQPA